MEQLEQAKSLLTNLYGLPPVLLVAAFSIVVGWGLKVWDRFNNKFIPLTVVGVCTVLTPIATIGSYDHSHAITPQVLNHVFVGTIVGCLSWVLHNKILKKIEDKLPFIGPLLADDDPPKPPPG